MCIDLGKLKMKGVGGRPRKVQRKLKNPFEIGCGFNKGIKKKYVCKKGLGSVINQKAKLDKIHEFVKPPIEKEAKEISECA